MNSPTSHSGTATALAPNQAILQSNPMPQTQGGIADPVANSAMDARPVGYGLPCAKCRTYYSAALKNCPVCKAGERVSPTAVMVPLSATAAESVADSDAFDGTLGATTDVLEEERERFLRQFKSQVYAAHTQINTSESFLCNVAGNHTHSPEPAAICQNCYGSLQSRADQMEASLHIDVKEAAQIIYDAVWSDPSDPSKTYQNAAQALISELHKRAGISAVLGPLQPLSH